MDRISRQLRPREKPAAQQHGCALRLWAVSWFTKACAKPGEGAGAVGKACFQKMNGSCDLVGLEVAVIVLGMNGSDAAWPGAFV